MSRTAQYNMSEIGIVSVHKTNKPKYKFFCGIKVSECKSSYIPHLDTAIFISEKRYKKASEKRFLKLFEKSVKKLEKFGITKVFKSKELAELCGERSDYGIPAELLPHVFLISKSICGTAAVLPKLTIKADSNINLEQLLSDIVMCAKQTEVYTDNVYAAKQSANFIFEQFGLITDIYDISDFDSSRSKYVIDAEKNSVRIGDFKTDSIVLGVNLGDKKIAVNRIFGENMPVNITNNDAVKLLNKLRFNIQNIYIDKIICGKRTIDITADSLRDKVII